MSSRPIYWNASISIDPELTNISGCSSFPIYCSQEWYDVVLQTGYYCHLRHGKLGTHPIIIDNQAPDFTDLVHLYKYSLQQYLGTGSSVTSVVPVSKCDCNLGGVHERWCDEWEAY